MLHNKMLYYYVMLLLVSIYGKEIVDDSDKYQYMEIFRNIPKLFEYFLSRLAEKPEVLEKDDITMFVRSANLNNEYGRANRNDYCENVHKSIEKDKYEVNRETTLSDIPDESKSLAEPQFKTEIKLNELSHSDQSDNMIKHNKKPIYKKAEQTKRGINADLNNVDYFCLNSKYTQNCTTNSNHNIKRYVVNRTYKVNANIEAPEKKYNLINKKPDEIRNLNIHKIKKSGEKLNKLSKKVVMRKRQDDANLLNNNKNYRKRYSIDDSKLFNLSPEDIEDTVLMVEEMLEEYNNKQSKEVN